MNWKPSASVPKSDTAISLPLSGYSKTSFVATEEIARYLSGVAPTLVSLLANSARPRGAAKMSPDRDTLP